MGRLARIGLLIAVLGLFVSGCASSRHGGFATPGRFVKDNNPAIWRDNHPSVMAFIKHYSGTRTVEKALQRSRAYMRRIIPEFRRRKLPMELAYLPLLESLFDPKADSGHARGLWQFTPQTAEEMGMRVGRFIDDRISVRKSTRAAAEYLDRLGRRFNYNWALALAAYNGGPNYVAKAMRRQHKWDFWSLELRKETAEYVPRFLAMLRVAQEKFPHLMVAELGKRGKRGRARVSRRRRVG